MNKECIECKRILEINEYYFKSNPKSVDGFNKKCKECSTGKKVFTECGYKICASCQINLPMNTDYYFTKKCTYDGFNNKCKKCNGYEYTQLLTKVAKEGYNFCIKCDAELKLTPAYFPIDNTCKNGFRNVCRKCGKDGRYFEEDYIPIFNWTEEENELFKKRYPHYLNSELIEIFYPKLTEKQLWDRANRMNVRKSHETYLRGRLIQSEKVQQYFEENGKVVIEETKNKLSDIMKKRWSENPEQFNLTRNEDYKNHLKIKRSKLGKWRGDKNPRAKDPLKGNKNPNWRGGITPERFKIRNSQEYADWRISVFQRDKNTCQRCGNKNYNEAHHIKCFSLNEDLRFDIDNGITLCRYCHNSNYKGALHNIYGTQNVTLEQLREYFKGISWDIDTKRASK